MLRIGLFRDFKGINAAVLVDADENDIEFLLASVSTVSASAKSQLAVHQVSMVSKLRPVKLYLSQDLKQHDAAAYYLGVGVEAAVVVSRKLQSLRSHSGHQYFDLIPSTATLVVSVGEYDQLWWESADA